MTDICPFCGRDPYHRVNNGLGMEAVAIVCCEAACAVSSKDAKDDDDYTITIGELRELGSKIAYLQARNDAYEEKYDEIWPEPESNDTP